MPNWKKVITSGSNASLNTLGIGTTDPQEKLDISAGDIRLDDNFSINWATDDANIGRVRIAGNEANDFLQFATDNSERMRLTNTGLGIGTTAPGAKLQIGSATHAPSGNLANNLLQIKSPSGFAYLTIGNGDVANSTAYIAGASGLITLGSVTDAGVTSEYIRMGNTGNVGIGTTSPDAILHVKGSTDITEVKIDTDDNALGDDALIKFNGSRAQVGWIDAAVTLTDGGGNKDIKLKVDTGTIFLQTNNTNRLTVADGGNVGIGTTSPSEKLEVDGNLKADSFIKDGGTSTQFLMADGSVSTSSPGTSGSSGTSGNSGSSGSSGTSGNSGAPGSSGSSGTSGNSGSSGSSGTSGNSGSSGSSGTSGNSGSSGSSGTSGNSGSSGSSGTSGGTGNPGSSGSSGTSGNTGSSGSSGTSGNSGSSGSSGTSGNSGSSGSSGTSGNSGNPGSSGSSGTSGNTGSSGSSGTSGNSGSSGSSGTSGGTGNPGSSGSSGTSGNTGSSGSSGTSGNTGSSGSSGTSGNTGSSGSSGTSGNSGNPGSSGSSGTSGNSGSSGSSGTSGNSGSSGSSGTSGNSGSSGSSGTSGNSGSSGSSGTSGNSGAPGSSGSSGTSGNSGSSGSSGTSGNSGSSGSSGTSGNSGAPGSSGSSGTSGNSGSSGSSGTSGNSGSSGSSGTSGTATITGAGSNRIMTSVAGSILNGESNLKFDGSVLSVEGQINFPDGELGTAEGFGEIVDFGNGSGFTAGDIYTLDSTNTWTAAHADNLGTYSTGMLAVALGTTPSAGMLVKGYARFTSNSNYTAMSTIGAPLYLEASLTPPGDFLQNPPSNAGEMVRVVGYVVSTSSDIMWFDPDPTWVEIA